MHGRRRRSPPKNLMERLSTAVFQKYDDARPSYLHPKLSIPFVNILKLSRTNDFETTINSAKEELRGTEHYKTYMALANLFLDPFSKRNNLPNKIEFIRASRYAHKDNAQEIMQILLQWLLLIRIDQDIKKLIGAYGYTKMRALIEWKEEATNLLRIKGRKYRLFQEPKPLLIPLTCSVVGAYFLLKSYSIYSNTKDLTQIGRPSFIMQYLLAAISTGAAYVTRQYTLTHIYEKAATLFPTTMLLAKITAPTILMPGIFLLIVAHYMDIHPSEFITPPTLLTTAILTAAYAAHRFFSKPNRNMVKEEHSCPALLVAD